MADKPHPEMGYRGCLGVIRLAGKYSHARMEFEIRQFQHGFGRELPFLLAIPTVCPSGKGAMPLPAHAAAFERNRKAGGRYRVL